MVQQSFLESRVMIVYYINCSVSNTVYGIHEDKRNCDLYSDKIKNNSSNGLLLAALL